MKQMGYKPDEHTYRQLMEINSRGGDYKTSLLYVIHFFSRSLSLHSKAFRRNHEAPKLGDRIETTRLALWLTR